MIKGNKWKCWYCGNEERCTKDHFYPKSKKGRTMVYACAVCQGSKKSLHPLEWLKYIQGHVAITDEAKQRISNAVTSLHLQLKDKECIEWNVWFN
jgi:hypothetical protein